jgi:hypothetical protein
MLGHLVVERTTSLIGGLRLPVDPPSPCLAGLRVNAFDECAADALTTKLQLGEEILQVADRLNLCCGEMEEVMRNAGNLPIGYGNESEDWLEAPRLIDECLQLS